jgi:hypothetical protein
LYLRYEGASDEFKNFLNDGLKGKYYTENNLAVSEIRKKIFVFLVFKYIKIKYKLNI